MIIAHLSSVHSRIDTRIFLKECQSLMLAGYQVSLIVADSKGDEEKNGVKIYDVGKCKRRVKRITKIPGRIFKKALSLDADLYHLHDPELIPIGLKLKRLGKKVVFDSHEDIPKQMIGKPYLNKPALWFIAKVFSAYETWACSRFDAIITATPFIREKFLKINPVSVDINNFPMLAELTTNTTNWSEKGNEVCYVGGIGSVRGIKEIAQAMDLVSTKTRLLLGGKFSESAVESEVKGYSGWKQVDELGFIDREGVRDTLSRSVAGLVTLHPIINYIDALPVKMFEYMSAGIPVIASNFPLWCEIVEGNDCGICVDPLNPTAIAGAIDFLVENPKKACEMGRNGRRAVEEKYNWKNEEKKFLDLYRKILC